MAFKKALKLPSQTQDSEPQDLPSIADQWEAMEEGRMDRILKTLEEHSSEPSISTPPSKNP